MKIKVKKWVEMISLATIMMSTTGFFASAQEGGHSGNGGALVERNGQYLSFKTVGIKTVTLPLQELTDADLPELSTFETKLERVAVVRDVYYALGDSVRMSAMRKYYHVKLTDIPAEVIKQMMNEYKKAVSPDFDGNIVLAAITKGNETYLFDPYFDLKNINSKLAILSHEAFWIMFPNSTYEKIINAEEAFESCMDDVDKIAENQQVTCIPWIKTLGEIYEEHTFLLRNLAYEDYSAGRLNPLLNAEKKIPISFIFPDSLLNMKIDDFLSQDYVVNDMIRNQIKSQMKAHPDLQFLPELYRWVDGISFDFGEILLNVPVHYDLGNCAISFWSKPSHAGNVRGILNPTSRWESGPMSFQISMQRPMRN